MPTSGRFRFFVKLSNQELLKDSPLLDCFRAAFHQTDDSYSHRETRMRIGRFWVSDDKQASSIYYLKACLNILN